MKQRVKEPVVYFRRGTPIFPSQCNDYLSTFILNKIAPTSRTETSPPETNLATPRGQWGQDPAWALKSSQRPPAPHHPPWWPSSWKHLQQFQGKLPNTFRMTKSHAFQHGNYSAKGKGVGGTLLGAEACTNPSACFTSLVLSSSGSPAAGVSLTNRKHHPWLIWKNQSVMSFHLLEMILDEEIRMDRVSLKIGF